MNTTAPQTYTQVPFAKLQDYLHHTASAEAVNYLEVTDIEAEALSVHAEDSEYTDEQSPIGSILKKCGKKVALKLPKTIKYLQSMKSCFSGCTGLVSLAAIPEGVKDLKLCFAGCKNLTEAPVIPHRVRDMSRCFAGCKSLIQVPALPESVTSTYSCALETAKVCGMFLLFLPALRVWYAVFPAAETLRQEALQSLLPSLWLFMHKQRRWV